MSLRCKRVGGGGRCGQVSLGADGRGNGGAQMMELWNMHTQSVAITVGASERQMDVGWHWHEGTGDMAIAERFGWAWWSGLVNEKGKGRSGQDRSVHGPVQVPKGRN